MSDKRRIRDRLEAKGFKRCTTCRQLWPLEDFIRRGRDNDRLRPICKSCRYRSRELRFYQRIGVTPERVAKDKLRGCGICGATKIKLDVDHDHETGKYRGILCDPHNLALGLLGDNIMGVKAALEYLDRSH